MRSAMSEIRDANSRTVIHSLSYVYFINFVQEECIQIKDYEIALIKSYEINIVHTNKPVNDVLFSFPQFYVSS
jgi:hypothetical protein